MIVFINGENQQIDSGLSIEKLLEQLDLSQKRLAVEINQDIVPRSEFPIHILKEADKIEIVQAIGGGSY